MVGPDALEGGDLRGGIDDEITVVVGGTTSHHERGIKG